MASICLGLNVLKRRSSNIGFMSHPLCLCSADDASRLNVKFNSADIDYIHGDKKPGKLPPTEW